MDDATEHLKQEVAALSERLQILEAQVAGLASANAPSPAKTPAAATAAPSAPADAPHQHRPSLPSFVVKSDEGRSLENRIGSQLFNRIGIIALFAGVAWFFKFAVDNGWLGPLTRIILGLVVGSAIVLWSESFRHRNYAGFSYTLKAVGTGVLYLTLWAAFSLYHFIPASVAFVGMMLVTLLNASLALSEDAELLGFYALSGGFSTPLLLSTGVDHEVFLFSYLLLLNAAVFVLIAMKNWTPLLIAAYPATIFYAIAWYVEHYDTSKRGITLFFAVLFWISFASVPPLLHRLRRADDRARHAGWLHIVLPVAHAVIAFAFFCTLLDSDLAPSTEAQGWGALVFGVAYLLLMLLARRDSAHPLTFSLNGALSVAFFTLFIPLYFSGRPIIYGWLVEGLILVLLLRLSQTEYAPALAAVPLLLAGCDLLVYDSFKSIQMQTVLANARFLCFVAAIAVLIGSTLTVHDKSKWSKFRSGAILAANLLALVAVSREIQTYWQASPTLFAERFSYSVWFMLYGAALLVVGFWRNSAFLRWQALVLLAFTIAKVFLYDMANLSQGYRVLSLLGLGALLLGVSFAYQRDWLQLRLRERA
jgi:uncharacterized membrane protein